MSKFIFIAFTLILGTSAIAAPTSKVHPIDAWTEKALESSGGVTSEIRNVYSEAYKKWDKDLNSVYRRLLSKLSPTDKQALINAQRSWLKWSQEETKFHSGLVLNPDSGTLALVIADAHGVTQIRQRVLDLLQYEVLHDSPP